MSDRITETLKFLRDQGRDDLANALVEQDQALTTPVPSPPAPRFVDDTPQNADEAWQQAASAVAWKAIVDARARAGRPIEE
jgi:hypothetical protein